MRGEQQLQGLSSSMGSMLSKIGYGSSRLADDSDVLFLDKPVLISRDGERGSETEQSSSVHGHDLCLPVLLSNSHDRHPCSHAVQNIFVRDMHLSGARLQTEAIMFGSSGA